MSVHIRYMSLIASINFFRLLFSLLMLNLASGLRLTNMTAPVVADTRKDMNLDCHFDMETEELYAVKWYKDDQEFFRYMPHQQPHVMSFPVTGVYLVPHSTDCGRQHCRLQLTGLRREHSGGAYRCEISSEAPTFRLAAETHNITVATLPLERPVLDGVSETYTEGDELVANCSSSPSDPAPILTWYINDKEVPSHFLGDMKIWDIDGLEARWRTIHFQVNRTHSRGNSNFIELHCISSLPGVPVAPQTTTRTFFIKSRTPPSINNQKWVDSSLSSSSSSSSSSSPSSSCGNRCDVRIFLLFILLWQLVSVRWRFKIVNSR